MPKRKNSEPPEEQSARFLAEVERLIVAGELSPTEAEAAIDSIVRQQAVSRPK